ncbi:hypothetical protein B0H66DRAFT_542549 [Apodospora peruviana]|uniref:RRM domain-containing protein n=1 Tax=Apodospora peruviana TaxID=516989 RepID=A0AAE0IS30_9PEZI|nr:hypothetical protein B0H66DRAFT_542549 [Apodospora peruviana]
MQSSAADALGEGRRIYMGNLLYSVQPVDVETLLQTTSFSYDKIHISVDPISGRNPGYCFIEFTTRDEAERALVTLAGVTIQGRPVKLGPCHPKTNTNRATADFSPRRRDYAAPSGDASATSSPARGQHRPGSLFQRWGDWTGDKHQTQPDEQGPYGALKHVDEAKMGADNRRLYVGGLGKMIDQEQNDAEIRALFNGFDIVAIGKRITPHPSTRTKPGNHHYCFVDFSSQDEALRAMKATNKVPVDGGFLRVFLAKPRDPETPDSEGAEEPGVPSRAALGSFTTRSPRPARRQADSSGDGGDVPVAKDDREEKAERFARTKVIMESNNWRRGN